MKKHLPFILIVILFSILGMKALTHPGLFTAHDIWHQVARLYHYHQAILAGQFPPYWISNLSNGFGYPLFFFSYHLPWIISVPFLSFGFEIPTTIKSLFFISYVFSGIAMYSLAHELLKNKWAALVSAIVYLWAPYHFLVILVSAAMGTAFVFLFLPLILLGIHKQNILLIASGMAGSILSHLMTTMSLLPMITIFTIWTLSRNPKSLIKILIGFLLGMGLSAFYLIPAVYYSHLTQVSTGAFSDIYKKHFVSFSQLVYSRWGYGIADTAKEMNISFQVGIVQWVAFMVAAIFVIISVVPALAKGWSASGGKAGIHRIPVLAILLSFLVSVFLMLDLSRPLWDFASQFVTLDYPTMFLLPATFSGSLAAGYFIHTLKSKLRILASLTLIAIAIYTNRNHLRVNEYTYIPVKDYIASEMTTNSFNEYLPKTADAKLLSEPVPPSIHHFSFPGVNLYIDGKNIKYDTDDRGRVIIPNNVENSKQTTVKIKFEDTILIKISKSITIASIIISGFLLWQKRKLKSLP